MQKRDLVSQSGLIQRLYIRVVWLFNRSPKEKNWINKKKKTYIGRPIQNSRSAASVFYLHSNSPFYLALEEMYLCLVLSLPLLLFWSLTCVLVSIDPEQIMYSLIDNDKYSSQLTTPLSPYTHNFCKLYNMKYRSRLKRFRRVLKYVLFVVALSRSDFVLC